MKTRNWTKQEDAAIERLWKEGHSASQIAALTGWGVTRNAIIGRLHRLGLSGRGLPTQPIVRRQQATPIRYKKRHAAPPRSGPPKPKSGAARINPKVEKIATLVASNAVSAPLSKALLIDALTERTCRWMDGDPKHVPAHYCGHETMPGTPWCTYHFGRVYYRGSQADFDRIAGRIQTKETAHVIMEAA